MTPANLERIHRLLQHLASRRDQLVIDADTHISDVAALTGPCAARYAAGPDYYHGRPISLEDLLLEMDMAGVDAALSWQNPAATATTDDRAANYEALLAANRYVAHAAALHPLRLIPGGWTDPRALGLDGALRLTDVLVTELGFLFVKMNPAQNRFPIDSGEVIQVVRHIVELGAIPAFHFGADTPFTPVSGIETVARAVPNSPILAVHMGGGGAGYVEGEPLALQAREFGLRHPNIRYALSAKRDTHIETDLIRYTLAGPPFSQNLFCASDAPYGRMTWNFGGYRAMFHSLLAGARHPDPRLQARPGLFTPHLVQGYLGRNFADFALAGYRHLSIVQSWDVR